MNLIDKVEDIISRADGKALATTGRHGLNVVPVSTARVIDGQIYLMNYFMLKTKENIQEQAFAAFTCWRGFAGYQIKGKIQYLESGELFESQKEWVSNNVPSRTLRGLLILTPDEIFDITPGATS